MKTIWVFLLALSLLAISANAVAYIKCEEDGNDTEDTATPVWRIEKVEDIICADIDPVDYYVLEIPDGAEVTGTISLTSKEAGTILKVISPGDVLYNEHITGRQLRLEYTFSGEPVEGGKYFFEVTFVPIFAGEHEYTLYINLTGKGLTECLADDNESRKTASRLGFGDTVSDWLCAEDHLDIWHFRVNDPATEGRGTIKLTSDPEEIEFHLYDDAENLVYQKGTVNGTVVFIMGTAKEPLPAGDYYAGIFLPHDRIDEISYTLELTPWAETAMPAAAPSDEPPTPSPWPNPMGNAANTGRSALNGPSGDTQAIASYDLQLELEIDQEQKGFFSGLRVGGGNRIYFVNRLTDELFCYDASGGFLWRHPISTRGLPGYLDDVGRIYTIGTDDTSLVCIDRDGYLNWRRVIPTIGNHSVKNLGENIYTLTVCEKDESYISAWGFDGSILWTIGPFTDPVRDIAEDGGKYIYVKTTGGLFQYDGNADPVWVFKYPGYLKDPFYSEPIGSLPVIYHGLGPIIGADGKVWIDDKTFGSFFIFNPDGTMHLQNDYEFGTVEFVGEASGRPGSYKIVGSIESPRWVGATGDGEFYVLTKANKLICYEDWINKKWETAFDSEVSIKDQIIGADGIVYLIYSQRFDTDRSEVTWVSISPDDGSIINTEPAFGLPGYGHDKSCKVAIGDGGSLICMHASGFITVFE